MKNYENVRRVLQDYVANNEIAGASIIIQEGDEVCLKASVGWQDDGKKIPVNEHTIYRLASMTKPITAAAVMILSDEGKLDIGDPISKYLPEYAGTDKEKIQIIHLLNHSCGLGMVMCPGMMQSMALSDPEHDRLEDRVRRWTELILDFPVGTATGYSPSVGFDIAGRIVEVVSGMELDEFFRKKIFEPLGIEDITFILNEEQRTRRSVVFHDKKLDENPSPASPTSIEPYADASLAGYFCGSAGLFGTAEDYNKIVQMYAHDGYYNGVQLLKKETVQRMRTASNDLLAAPGVKWGLGMQVFGTMEETGYCVNEGSYTWSGAYGTHFFIDPKANRTFVLMLNSDNLGGSASYISRAVEKAIWEAK